MFDAQAQRLALASEIEVRVPPGVELRGSAKGLSGPGVGCSLAGMVNEQHGHLEAALEMAQVAEHGGDLGGDVLVDAVQADEGIEHEQPRPEPLDGLSQSALVLAEIETQTRADDDVDVE